MSQTVKESRITRNHHILLAVSGSIAAFKAAELASDLVQDGQAVQVILTAGGARFVTPLTFSAITAHPVATDLWQESGSSSMGHLDLANWGEILVVAPASANTLARLALGFSDDLLGAVGLAWQGPFLIAPAMEARMWAHEATQEHVAALKRRGAQIVGPDQGHLASGSSGEGRMVEPERLLEEIRSVLDPAGDLHGLKVLVTAGPTFEPIDPIRYLGNRSSGKMGIAIAEEAADRGGDVLLVLGPSHLGASERIREINVETSADMRDVVLKNAAEMDVIVNAAAVADFRPDKPFTEKLRREQGMELQLVPTDDIAAEAAQAAPHALHIGFALETSDLVESARKKLEAKGLDLVVANLASDDHNPMGSDFNRVVFVTAQNERDLGAALPKPEVARELWDEAARLREAKQARAVAG